MHRAIALLAVAALALGGCGDAAGPVAPTAELERDVRTFFLGMAAEDPDENRRAMGALMPVAEDFEALVPGHGPALWAVWERQVRRLVSTAPSASPDYRNVLPIRGIRLVDLRQSMSIELHRALEVVARDVPVYGVEIEVTPGERAATAFVWVRGRWVWVWELERVSDVVAKATGG